MEKRILHVDVNNAFLSWTALSMLEKGSSLDIRTIPAVIGGDETKRKGVVLAKSMPAKQFGIKTGEPIAFARKKCPNITVYSSDFKIYRKNSELLYQLLLEYTEKIERFSIDECFLDLSDLIKTNDELLEIAYEINAKVKSKLGFTVNIGVANNKLLAKMASDFQKPDKVHTLWTDEIQKKMWILPVSDLFMVGKKTLPKLNIMGIKTIGDLAKQNQDILAHKFGKHGEIMWEYANGIDRSEVEYQNAMPKGIGNSITLSYDISNIEKLKEILLALTEQVTYRLRKHDLCAKVVNVQIKTKDFKVFSHQKQLDIPTDSTRKIFEIAKQLLEVLHQDRQIRLLGVRVDNLSSKGEQQLSLFDQKDKTKQEKLDQTIDHLKNKYGYNSITRAGKMEINDIIQFKE